MTLIDGIMIISPVVAFFLEQRMQMMSIICQAPTELREGKVRRGKEPELPQTVPVNRRWLSDHVAIFASAKGGANDAQFLLA